MMFRKKPVIVEAWQVPGFTLKDKGITPDWLLEAITAGAVTIRPSGTFMIRTLEGTMAAEPGDWIIRGVKGELYPCKPDIFAATYEPAVCRKDGRCQYAIDVGAEGMGHCQPGKCVMPDGGDR